MLFALGKNLTTATRFRGGLMDVDDLILISVDDDVTEPPGLFERPTEAEATSSA
jgi:hypothetical protein